MSESSGKNKPLHEHIATILPFRVLEATEGKPLRIAGVAMTAGMSRNHNVYTSGELQAFAPKLIGSPLYLEHVTVNSAIGKVTNCTFDAQTKSLLYEAEIYDPGIAEKIRQGLIQHVSVGADYDTLDSASVPHGLHNAEMSLVAVPGIPETNIQILESLLRNGPVKVQEQDGQPACAVCGQPADFLISICQGCLDKAGAGAQAQNNEGETMEEKDVEKLAEKLAAKLSAKEAEKLTAVEAELTEKKNKLSEAEGKLASAEGKLAEANNTVEKLKQLVPGVDLLSNPPKLMPVSEVLERLGRLELPKMQERLSLGNQLQAQKVRKEIFEVKQKYGVA